MFNGPNISSRGGKVFKVPCTGPEALASPLMGLFEKRRCQKFLEFVQNYERDDPKTHNKLDLSKKTPKELMSKDYGLEADTIDFLGHSLALYLNDEYLDRPGVFPCFSFPLSRVLLYFLYNFNIIFLIVGVFCVGRPHEVICGIFGQVQQVPLHLSSLWSW
jgi:RAB protein geranylgeranyltransferase component A